MRQRLVKHQQLDDVNSKKKYWEFAHARNRRDENGDIIESRRANPDVFAEDSSMYHMSDAGKETQRRVGILMTIAQQILTTQQYNVFFFLTMRTMTERQVAKVMGISQQRVHAIWIIAREKLQVAYETRTA